MRIIEMVAAVAVAFTLGVAAAPTAHADPGSWQCTQMSDGTTKCFGGNGGNGYVQGGQQCNQGMYGRVCTQDQEGYPGN